MLENNENRPNGENKETEYVPAEHSENAKPSKAWTIENIKKHIISIGKLSWRFVKGYLVIIKEWFTGKRSTRADILAMAIFLFFAVSVWL